ncbi:hypothetical protein BJX61DRAFT_540321 [Aspergillus egyptiacus]|nr:hypothetical protein BJX61DRAFT_540321 [Aspergillus egyptiacus]
MLAPVQKATYKLFGKRINDFTVLPLRISSMVEGWRLEAWVRLDRRITAQDIIDRVHPEYRANISPEIIDRRRNEFRRFFWVSCWDAGFEHTIAEVTRALEARGVNPQLNSTRGLTPGLKNPAVGAAGGVVNCPPNFNIELVPTALMGLRVDHNPPDQWFYAPDQPCWALDQTGRWSLTCAFAYQTQEPISWSTLGPRPQQMASLLGPFPSIPIGPRAIVPPVSETCTQLRVAAQSIDTIAQPSTAAHPPRAHAIAYELQTAAHPRRADPAPQSRSQRQRNAFRTPPRSTGPIRRTPTRRATLSQNQLQTPLTTPSRCTLRVAPDIVVNAHITADSHIEAFKASGLPSLPHIDDRIPPADESELADHAGPPAREFRALSETPPSTMTLDEYLTRHRMTYEDYVEFRDEDERRSLVATRRRMAIRGKRVCIPTETPGSV